MVVVLIEGFKKKNVIDISGESDEFAVMKELHKIHDMNTYKPMDASMLIYQERKHSIDLVTFITEKRNRDIKARKVAVGIKLRTYNGYDKSNILFHTLNTDMVFLTGVIDVHDHRSVAMLCVVNVFMYVENY